METLNCTEKQAWVIRIPDFPVEKREKVISLAKDSRQKIGSYLGSLLDKEIEKQHQMK